MKSVKKNAMGDKADQKNGTNNNCRNEKKDIGQSNARHEFRSRSQDKTTDENQKFPIANISLASSTLITVGAGNRNSDMFSMLRI